MWLSVKKNIYETIDYQIFRIKFLWQNDSALPSKNRDDLAKFP